MGSAKNGKLESMNEIFYGSLKDMKIGREYKNKLIIYAWPRIVGKNFARHAEPVKLEYKKLYLSCCHPAWAEQVKYYKSMILDKVNNFMGEYLVHDLILVSMPGSASQPAQMDTDSSAPGGMPEKPELKEITVEPQELEDLKNLCSSCENEQLRQKMEQLGISFIRKNKYQAMSGWHKCGAEGCQNQCGPEAEYCLACTRNMRLHNEKRIRDMLYDMPWATYADIYKEIKCSANAVNEQRVLLLQQLAARVRENDRTSLDAKVMVMLYKSLPPDQLTEEIIEKTMQQLRFDLLSEEKSGERARHVSGQKRGGKG